MTITKTIKDEAKVFLTDYNSYNNGTQFEFGHWVDLSDFNDADELNEYILKHFKDADKKSPLDSPREEIMITDFEGFPSSLYSECMNFENLYKFLNLEEDDKIKVAFVLDQNHGDIKEALEMFENVNLYEYDYSNASKYELFEMYYEGAYEQENEYMKIDEDAFIRSEFTEFEYEGITYLIHDNWNH
jgi:NADH:ubiquinone oxidoreductase subunit C